MKIEIGNFKLEIGRTLAPQEKSLSPDMQAFLSGSDLDVNDGGANKYVTAYAQSAWVYTAVCVLSRQVARIPFRISRVGSGKAKRLRALRSSSDPRHKQFCRRALNETIIDSGDVVDLFNNPHPTMDAKLFWEMVITWNCLRGEFFVLPLDGLDRPCDLTLRNPGIERMITLPTELFWHIVVGYELEGWRYTGSPLLTPIPSEVLLPSEVVHSRTPNPYLYWRGMSPLIVADLACRTDYAGEQYIKGLWVNNADTGVIVTTEQQTDKAQREAILAALRERKRKAGTADRPLFLWGGAKVEKPTLSSLDMQYLETRKFLREEIGAILEVPQTLMGFNDDKASALSGGGQAISAERLQFIEGPISGHCFTAETALNKIVRVFGDDLVGWFDVESLPICQEARRARIDTAAKAFAIGVPFNDANEAYDLGFRKLPWGDKSFLPFNLQEVTKDGLGANDPGPSEDDPEKNPGKENDDDENENDNDQKSNPVSRALALFASMRSNPEPKTSNPERRTVDVVNLWKKHITARKAHVNLFTSKTGKVLMAFRKKTLAKLDEVHLEKSAGRLNYEVRAAGGDLLAPANCRSLIDLIFNANDFGAALYAELETPIRSLLQSAGEQLNQEIGQPASDDPWKYPPKGVLDFLADRKQKIMGVGGTVRDQLNTSLQEGIQNGETHDQLTARVKAAFTDMTTGEAKRVAMTEVNIGYNTARHQAMTDAGIEFKAWLSSHGPHVRPAHAAAEDSYIDDPIPLDDPFIVMGEQLMFPGDDSLGASLENIINCQCIQLAAQKKTEDEKSVTYLILGFGPMTFQKKEAA